MTVTNIPARQPPAAPMNHEAEFDAVKTALIDKLGSMCSELSDLKVWHFGSGREGVMQLAAALAKVGEINIPNVPF